MSFATVGVAACASELNAAPRFSITTIDVPGILSVAAMNSHGKVVGTAAEGDEQPHGFVWSINSQGGQQVIRLRADSTFRQLSPAAINSLDQLCGRAASGPDTSYQVTYAVFWNTPTDELVPLGRSCPWGDLSFATGINDSGEVVGRFGGCPPNAEGENSFLYSGGLITPIGSFLTRQSTTPDGVTYISRLSTALAINNGGVIAGQAFTENADGLYERHVFRVHREALNSLEDMGTLGGWVAQPYAINSDGTVVGEGDSDRSRDYTRAFRTPANRAINAGSDMIPTLGGSENSARSINDSDQVVGTSSLSDDRWHAFLFENELVTDLNDLIPSDSGWELTEAYGINHDSFIVGQGTFGGERRFFLLRPLITDLVAVSLTWNNATGELDAGYRVDNAGLPTATTAKLFWANGPSKTDILSPTPIFTHTIPAGATGSGPPVHVPVSVFSAPPSGASYVLLVLDYDDAVGESDERNNVLGVPVPCPIGYMFPVSLMPLDDQLPRQLKVGDPRLIQLTVELAPITLQFHVVQPTETGAICKVSTEGHRDMNLKCYMAGAPVGTIRIADLFAHVTLTLFEDSVAPAYDAECSGAHGCYLNAHMPGHHVVQWFNPGFQITPVGLVADVPFLGNPKHTEPLEVWVDIENRGLTLQMPFETIMDQVEQFIEAQNQWRVYYRRAFWHDAVLTIIDPGRTELLVTSPTGEQTGRMDDGTIDHRIPFSAYFSQVPLVVVMDAEAGDYTTLVRGVEDSDYDLISMFGDFASITTQQDFHGHVAVAQTATHSSIVPPKLEIKRTDVGYAISWPTFVVGFTLEYGDSLTNPVWTPVPGVMNNSITLPIDRVAKFYRLRRP
jgi:probable HAF family extracellular repeat protein